MRNVIDSASLSSDQLKKMAVIADHCYQSADLAVRCMLELRNRSAIAPDAIERYMGQLNPEPAAL